MTTRKIDEQLFLSQQQNAKIIQQSHINSYFYHSQGRIAAEKFVWEIYQHHFKADIQDFYPHLLALQSNEHLRSENHKFENSPIQAVAGLRAAQGEQLFSEYYLPHSIETELQKIFPLPVSRDGIVEIGNMALSSRHQIRWLIIALMAYLYAVGFHQVVFTAIPAISNSFKRIGLSLHEIADAQAKQLPEKIQYQWGDTYYQLKPKVFATDIAEGYAILAKQIKNRHPSLQQFWQDALHLGTQHYKVAKVA